MPHKLHTTPLSTAYARSLLELANEKNQAREIGQELEELAGIIDANPLFATFLSNPAIGETERGALVEKVFSGRVSALVMNFMLVANRKGRLGQLRQIASTYSELLDQQSGIVEVDVYAAQKLSDEELGQVRQKVGGALKREVVLHQYVDESIIGGLVLRLEDQLLDASVRAHLKAIRRQLLAARRK
jgi:F-type H+-transporting ATPase subunit delta